MFELNIKITAESDQKGYFLSDIIFWIFYIEGKIYIFSSISRI